MLFQSAIAGRLGQLPAVARWETVAVRLENDLRDAQRSLALQAAAIDSFRSEELTYALPICHCRAPRPTTGGSSLGDGGGAPGERSARRAALPGTAGCRDRFLPGRDEAQRKSPGLGGGYSRSATDERDR